MLGKLIRHEFKATWMPMALTFGGLLAASGLARLFILLLDVFVKDETAFTVFSMLITMMHIILFVASLIIVLVLAATRFYNHLYSAQGYLTLMIPAPRWQHLFSKTIVSVVWYVVGTAAALTSVSIVVSFTEIGYLYADVFSAMGTSLGLDGPFMITVSILSGIVSCFEGILMIYLAISIGQLFKKHRVVGAVLGYFCINTVINTVTSVLTVISTVSQTAVYEAFEGQTEITQEIASLGANITSVVMLLFAALFTVIMYMITNYILKRAVNLQ